MSNNEVTQDDPSENEPDDDFQNLSSDSSNSEGSFGIEDYTSSTNEIIVKPVLPPRPGRPGRSLMVTTGNSASINTFPKLKKAYNTLRINILR